MTDTRLSEGRPEAVKWYLEAVEKEKEGKMMEAVNCYSKAYKLDPKLEDEDYAMEMYYKYKEPPKEDVLSCNSYTWGFKLFIVDLERKNYCFRHLSTNAQ